MKDNKREERQETVNAGILGSKTKCLKNLMGQAVFVEKNGQMIINEIFPIRYW